MGVFERELMSSSNAWCHENWVSLLPPLLLSHSAFPPSCLYFLASFSSPFPPSFFLFSLPPALPFFLPTLLQEESNAGN